VLVIAVIVAMMALVPMVRGDVKNFTLNITSPEKGGVGYTDVFGTPITVEVEVNSPSGIKDVIITNGINQNICRIAFENRYICPSPWQTGRNSNKITAPDNSEIRFRKPGIIL
jgi:hypothetical protein